MRLSFIAACHLVATTVLAHQTPLVPSLSPEPCAQVSAVVSASSASYLAANPTGTTPPSTSTATVDGALFHACLQSIPLNQSAALDLIHALEPYIELQSTLEYLSAPPGDDWQHPPVDIKASLRSLADDVVSGRYISEYSFQTSLYKTFLSAHDAHFNFIPDLFGVGSFKIPGASLVSVVSQDPSPHPHSDSISQSEGKHRWVEVYFVSDVLEIIVDADDEINAIPMLSWIDGSKRHANAHAQDPSLIASINGVPVSDFLLSMSLNQSSAIPFHDPHAAYNFLFFEISQLNDFDLSAKQGAFPNPVFYPGPETVFGFANGTTVRIQTVAEVHVGFDGVYDGRSAYEKFCHQKKKKKNMSEIVSQSTSIAAEVASDTQVYLNSSKGDDDEHQHEHLRPAPPAESGSEYFITTLPFYPPSPIVTDKKGRMTGYFLEDDGFNDTAVLAILDFSVMDDDDDDDDDTSAGFQHTLAKFLDKCKFNSGASPRTKLILDLFGNGGGTLELGVDAARRIFPNVGYEVYGNMRASNVLRDLGVGYDEYSGRASRTGRTSGTTQDHHAKDEDTGPHDRGESGTGTGSLFDVRSLLDVDGTAWSSWDDFYSYRDGRRDSCMTDRNGECGTGGQGLRQVTAPFRINCTATAPRGIQRRMAVEEEEEDQDEHGDEDGPIPTKPVFEPENVVVLTDGFCGSTCAVFVELLLSTHIRTAGTSGEGTGRGPGTVRSVVVGGIPTAADHGSLTRSAGGREMEMQVVGTTKGAAFWSFSEILDVARQKTKNETSGAAAAAATTTILEDEDQHRLNGSGFRFTDLPLRRTWNPGAAGVNGVNHLRYDTCQEDEKMRRRSMVPLQFVRTEADLRIFPTKETVVDKRALWRRVREVGFRE
ncbi:hypothetical protein PV08_11495 [Exophiala spinifera]|uniref:CPAF-like PDZ domain-containing protein n=1 Tax=Exophiala spinifera TaxID=91928 RepID=A0A0D1Y6P8_9EURO|nr:uncharacterized protein PV08_11495 [Exophiala spinifera]KIW10531.1 hypothetical protein PV08_11495 [Exophiala spinifera]